VLQTEEKYLMYNKTAIREIENKISNQIMLRIT